MAVAVARELQLCGAERAAAAWRQRQRGTSGRDAGGALAARQHMRRMQRPAAHLPDFGQARCASWFV